MSPSDAHDADGGAPEAAFLPILILGLAFVLWAGFQTYELVTERRALAAAHEAQVAQIAESAKLRGSLDAVASETQKLSDAGNADARLIVDELKKRGITISVGHAPEPPPP
jgi:hypothetical protein